MHPRTNARCSTSNIRVTASFQRQLHVLPILKCPGYGNPSWDWGRGGGVLQRTSNAFRYQVFPSNPARIYKKEHFFWCTDSAYDWQSLNWPLGGSPFPRRSTHNHAEPSIHPSTEARSNEQEKTARVALASPCYSNNSLHSTGFPML